MRPLFLRSTDPFLRWGCPALLCFATIAWGSVEAWSGMLLVGGCSAFVAVWLLRLMMYPGYCVADREAGNHPGSWSAGLHLPLIGLFGIGVLQLAPLGGLVTLVSPFAAQIQVQAGLARSSLTLSLAPAATLPALAQLSALALMFFALLDTLPGRLAARRLAAALLFLAFGHAIVGILWNYVRIRRPEWGAYSLPFGTYLNRNHFASLMAMSIPLGVGYLLSIGQRRPPERSTSSREEPAATVSAGSGAEVHARQALVGFATAVMAGALLLSNSRGGILVTALALAALALAALAPGLVRWRRARGRFRVAAAAVVAAVACSAWIAGDLSVARLAGLGTAAADNSARGRLDIWRDTARMVAEYPLFGTGFGTYAAAFPRYQSALAELTVEHAHNDWLQLLVEGGLAGSFAVLACLANYAVAVGRLLGRRRDREAICLALGGLGGLLAFLLHSFVDFNAHIPANALWFTVLAALTLKALLSRTTAGI